MIDTSSLFVSISPSEKCFDSLHAGHNAVILPHCKRSSYRYADSGTCGNFYRMDMGDVLARIAKRANELGLSEAGLSKAAGLSKDGIRNWRRRFEAGDEVAGANVSSISKVATALGVSELWLLHGIEDAQSIRPVVSTIAVAGRVGAGAKVDLVDAYCKGDGLYHVICPPQINPHGIVAVEVAGTSMIPTYEPGSVLFYSRDAVGVPVEAIGRICVCEDESGRAWVKQIKVGAEEGTFSLISLNPEAENMHGVRLKWAAPVRFSLPREYVRRSHHA